MLGSHDLTIPLRSYGNQALEMPKVSRRQGRLLVYQIAEHVSDDVSKRILKLSKYRLQLLLVKVNTCDHYNDIATKPYLGRSKNMMRKHVFAILTT